MPIVALVVYSFNDSPVRQRLARLHAASGTRRSPPTASCSPASALSLKIALRDRLQPRSCSARCAAFALVSYRRFFGRTLFAGMVAAPLVMPEVIIGLSLLLMLVSLQRTRRSASAFPSAAC